ncbi:ribokinase [Paenibacillus anaericanus]|uniref:ribokinase n=1 Tax=Paenibacillus anaericanus TaxID=170367 RepID=UPI00277E33F0|nr:ribokinase [Paenibacillus anaericanus]MDQ0086878.1 ribokinase [Paenibacillus anaericanus]
MKKRKIFVVGSLNMDIVVSTDRLPKRGETLTGQSVHYIPGGKGANQAVCCAKLGADSTIFGMVGDDWFGTKVLDSLHTNGVDTSYIQIHKSTPTGVASITHMKEDNTIVVVPGTNGLLTETELQEFEVVIGENDILLTQLEIPLQTVSAALRIAKHKGAVTILNPAPYTSLPDELLKHVDYLTPNETEFEQMIGTTIFDEGSLRPAIQEWQNLHHHSTMIIVTRGKQGCSYLLNDNVVTVTPPNVDVIDTVGAGDAFNGGLAYGLASDWDISRCIDFAVKVSATAVTRFGAQNGMPTQDDVLQITAK